MDKTFQLGRMTVQYCLWFDALLGIWPLISTKMACWWEAVKQLVRWIGYWISSPSVYWLDLSNLTICWVSRSTNHALVMMMMIIIINVDGQVMHPMTRSLDPNKEGENKATSIECSHCKEKAWCKNVNKNRTENKYLLSHYTNYYNVGQTNIQPR